MKKPLILLTLASLCFACEKPEEKPREEPQEVRKKENRAEKMGSFHLRKKNRDMIAMQVGEDQYKTEEDRQLVQKIRQAIANDNQLSLAAKNITLGVDGGKIRLEGFVNSEREKNLVTAKVRQIRGIQSIDNRLMVNQQKGNARA